MHYYISAVAITDDIVNSKSLIEIPGFLENLVPEKRLGIPKLDWFWYSKVSGVVRVLKECHMSLYLHFNSLMAIENLSNGYISPTNASRFRCIIPQNLFRTDRQAF